MKSLSSPSFFRVFDLLVGTSNPGLKLDHWTIDDVRCTRERHSFVGVTHSYSIDVVSLTRTGRWQLLVAKEYWWTGDHKRSIKMPRWCQPTAGSRREIMTWLRTREAELG